MYITSNPLELFFLPLTTLTEFCNMNDTYLVEQTKFWTVLAHEIEITLLVVTVWEQLEYCKTKTNVANYKLKTQTIHLIKTPSWCNTKAQTYDQFMIGFVFTVEPPLVATYLSWLMVHTFTQILTSVQQQQPLEWVSMAKINLQQQPVNHWVMNGIYKTPFLL